MYISTNQLKGGKAILVRYRPVPALLVHGTCLSLRSLHALFHFPGLKSQSVSPSLPPSALLAMWNCFQSLLQGESALELWKTGRQQSTENLAEQRRGTNKPIFIFAAKCLPASSPVILPLRIRKTLLAESVFALWQLPACYLDGYSNSLLPSIITTLHLYSS